MITTSLNTIDTQDVQWEVAHLFEHLIIDGYRRYIDNHGYGRVSFGWLMGETFESRLFIEGGFYSTKSAKMFEQYLQQLSDFSDEAILHQKQVIEAEARALINVNNESQLKRQLKILIQRLQEKASPINHPAKKAPIILQETPSARSFRDVTIKLLFENLSNIEAILLLRFKTILRDMVSDYISGLGGYERGASNLYRSKDVYGILQITTAKRGTFTCKDLAEKLQYHMKSYDYEKDMILLSEHFEEYSKEPLWKPMTIEYFATTGILATPQDVAAQLTVENIHSLIQKLTVQCKPTESVEYDYLKENG